MDDLEERKPSALLEACVEASSPLEKSIMEKILDVADFLEARKEDGNVE